jgi:polyhydroxyalkanoic acid synthase PhaR subunit
MANETEMDPFTMWREWLNQSERQWNGFLNEAMSTEQFSQAMGRSMDLMLNFQRNMNEAMGRYFSALNIPTRTDIMSLGDRLSAIEERLVEMEQLLARIQPPAASANADNAPRPRAEVPRPPRTRKPNVN